MSPPKKRNPGPLAGGKPGDQNQLATAKVPKLWHTRKQFASLVGLSTRTISRRIKDGSLIYWRDRRRHPRIFCFRENLK
jgi:hypothetical protein